MQVTILGYDTATDAADPSRDIVSGDLASVDDALDWVAGTASVTRGHLDTHGNQIWVRGACAPVAVMRDTATIARPDPAPAGATMEVGTGDAKGMPPGLAEEMASLPDPRVCDCGATPDPSESPDAGNYVENGVAKYICLRCWQRENGSDGGLPQ